MKKDQKSTKLAVGGKRVIRQKYEIFIYQGANQMSHAF